MCRKLVKIVRILNKWLYFGLVESNIFMSFLHLRLKPPMPILLTFCSPHVVCYMHAPLSKNVLGQALTSQVGTSQTSLHPCNLGHPIGIQTNRPYAWRIVVNFCTNLIGAKLSHRDKTWGPLCQDKWTNHSGLRKSCCSYNTSSCVDWTKFCVPHYSRVFGFQWRSHLWTQGFVNQIEPVL